MFQVACVVGVSGGAGGEGVVFKHIFVTYCSIRIKLLL